MKKTILLFAIFLSMGIFAQTCGFDQVQKELETQFPQIKKDREALDAKLLQTDLRAYLDKLGATSKNGMYTGTIYEIPIIVHVITSSDPSNASLSLSDAQIQTWIDNCNKMFATNFGAPFFPEGSGSLDGNVIPYKLVLAKRSPQCTASNGISRYNGSTIAGYDQYGVRSSGTNGATVAQIKTLAPHWPENAYFNIYIPIGFDGDKSTFGLMGWCGYPTNPDSSYESFMKATVITNVNDTTMAHEFGHGLGLAHVFDGANASPGNNPTAADCPANVNCLTDNDKICDTAPSASLLSVYPTPTNSVTNPCTNTLYDGVQYNIMNYTYSPRKFTAGQRDRAIAVFMSVRSNLTKSLGGTDLATDPGAGTLVAANCNPTGITNPGNFGVGPRRVVLGNIDNSSDPYSTGNPQYYVNYSLQNCTSKSVYTDIPASSPSQLSVSITTNPQYVKAWIDYNNNGIFESTELIGVSPSAVAVASSPYIITFTPVATAQKNTYLRMRVIADIGNTAQCANLSYGQAEDYSVRIPSTLATGENPAKVDGVVIYSKAQNKLSLVNAASNKDFGKYEVYNMSGTLIQKGDAREEIILKQTLPRGTYVVQYQNTSQKFIN